MRWTGWRTQLADAATDCADFVAVETKYRLPLIRSDLTSVCVCIRSRVHGEISTTIWGSSTRSWRRRTCVYYSTCYTKGRRIGLLRLPAPVVWVWDGETFDGEHATVLRLLYVPPSVESTTICDDVTPEAGTFIRKLQRVRRSPLVAMEIRLMSLSYAAMVIRIC